jgi:hypothetical protein
MCFSLPTELLPRSSWLPETWIRKSNLARGFGHCQNATERLHGACLWAASRAIRLRDATGAVTWRSRIALTESGLPGTDHKWPWAGFRGVPGAGQPRPDRTALRPRPKQPLAFLPRPGWWNWSDTVALRATALRHEGSSPSPGPGRVVPRWVRGQVAGMGQMSGGRTRRRGRVGFGDKSPTRHAPRIEWAEGRPIADSSPARAAGRAECAERRHRKVVHRGGDRADWRIAGGGAATAPVPRGRYRP